MKLKKLKGNETQKLAKIQHGPTEKVGFQVFVYFRFFMKPELVDHSLFKSWQQANDWQKVVGKEFIHL